jgi:membrane protein YqaA with SNARE-associated domain
VTSALTLTDLRVWEVVAIVSLLEVGGALIPYHVGKHGLDGVLVRFPGLKQERLDRVQTLYRERGSGVLFFSFVPVFGTLLSAAAGVVSMQLSTFVLWVLLGRTVRNSLLAVVTVQGLTVLG